MISMPCICVSPYHAANTTCSDELPIMSNSVFGLCRPGTSGPGAEPDMKMLVALIEPKNTNEATPAK